MSSDTPMMRQYRRIKEDHRDAILFFRLGDFYEMFFTDAREASAILNLTLTQRNGTPMCGIPYHAARNYIPRLLKAGKKVAICEQTDKQNPDEKIAIREVTQVISPGTITEQDYLDSYRDNFLLSICKIVDKLALAWLDVSTGKFEIDMCSWDSAYSHVQQELARLHPSELLIQESLLDTSLAPLLQSGHGWLINRYPDWFFSVDESYRKLISFFKVANLRGFGIEENEPALAAAGILLEYIFENAGNNLQHIRSIHKLSTSDFVPLNEATQRNLELVENLQDGGTEYTLYSVLNFTESPMGSRTLYRWLLQPLRKLSQIQKRQDAVSLLYHQQGILQSLREYLSSVRDLERLSARIGMQKTNPRDAEAIGASLSLIDSLTKLLHTDNSLKQVFPISQDECEAASSLAKHIAQAIADNPPANPADGGCIRTAYDSEVDRLRELYENSDSILKKYGEKLQAETGIQSLKIKYNRILGYFIEITKSNRSKVPDSFIPRQSLTQCDRFATKELHRIQSDLQTAEQNLVERELEVFSELRSKIEKELAHIQHIAVLLGNLDALQSLAYAATLHGYVQPDLLEDTSLEIIQGRHPVVEKHLPAGTFVPNSIQISQKYFALITGPNMAGKSTYLRQTALLVLMAQIGSYIPASSARIGIADNIFCRVGARDNLARGESTFLVEMTETAHILHSATSSSLVIMDEVGRGTSSTDGQAIAHAICNYLLDTVKTRTLFATHYHQLSSIQHPALCNLSLSIQENNGEIIFLREVQEGASNHSYGIQAARLAGIPQSILQQAQYLLSSIEPDPEISAQAIKASAPSKNSQAQALFSIETDVADRVRNISPETLSPLEALQFLFEIHAQLKE